MSGAMLAPSRGMLAKQDWIDFEDSEPPSDSTASDITLDHNIAGYYGDNSDNEGEEEEREREAAQNTTQTLAITLVCNSYYTDLYIYHLPLLFLLRLPGSVIS